MPCKSIIAHRTNRSNAQKTLKALEDPEQRPQSHACGCPSKHAQGQVAVTVSVPLTDDDLIGRLLSINSSYERREREIFKMPSGNTIFTEKMVLLRDS